MAEEGAKTEVTKPPKEEKVLVKCLKYPSLQAVVGNKTIIFKGGQALVDPADAKELLKREWISK